jgi:hypothetical protein
LQFRGSGRLGKKRRDARGLRGRHEPIFEPLSGSIIRPFGHQQEVFVAPRTWVWAGKNYLREQELSEVTPDCSTTTPIVPRQHSSMIGALRDDIPRGKIQLLGRTFGWWNPPKPLSVFLPGHAKSWSQTMQRRRFKHVLSFPDRLANEAERFREEAEKLPHGPERENFLRKARQADTALHMDKWLSSPRLQPPR